MTEREAKADRRKNTEKDTKIKLLYRFANGKLIENNSTVSWTTIINICLYVRVKLSTSESRAPQWLLIKYKDRCFKKPSCYLSINNC